MIVRPAPSDGDTHDRFHDWLVSGALGEPPRDAALHASVCPECAREIAAFDALAGISAMRAPLPPSRIGGRRSGWVRTVRVAGAASGVAAAAIVAGVGLGSALQLSRPGVTQAEGSTVQEVLGDRGTPAATVTPTPSPSLSATPSPSPTP